MAKVRSKNETKRKQILAASTKLFIEQGYASTSMDLIAKQADVSKQTVYSHFGSKDELFSAAIEQECDSYKMIDLSIDTRLAIKERLILVAHRFFCMITSKEAIAVQKICSYESSAYPQLSDLFYQAGPEKLSNEMTELMQSLHDEKVICVSNPRHAAAQFLNLVKGEATMRIEFNTQKQLSKAEVDEYIESSVELFLRGYAAN
jgi:TetR/AcrR family transcriptional repressor of mexJK operon